MAPKYQGQSPGQVWYMWQRTKALAATFDDPSTKSEAKSMGKSAAFSAASLLGGTAAFSFTFLGVPTLLLVAGVAGSGYFGVKTYHSVKYLKNTGAFSGYIRSQEEKWLEKKSSPKLAERVKGGIAKAGAVFGYGLAAAGAALGGIAALQYTGAISVAAVTTALGGVALPVVIAAGAVAAIAGTAVGVISHKSTAKSASTAAPSKASAGAAPSAEKSYYYSSVKAQPEVTDTFKKSAAPQPSESQIRNAAARAAAREARKRINKGF